MRDILFVGGVHGVGKTSICTELSKQLGLKHYSAGTLISRFKNEHNNKNKMVHDIEGNQNILLNAINLYTNQRSVFILDGHFCLLDTRGKITKISRDVFRDLRIRGILVIKDNVSKIQTRLMTRDNLLYDLDLLNEFQEIELQHSKDISLSLQVPYYVHDFSDSTEVLDYINVFRFLKP